MNQTKLLLTTTTTHQLTTTTTFSFCLTGLLFWNYFWLGWISRNRTFGGQWSKYWQAGCPSSHSTNSEITLVDIQAHHPLDFILTLSTNAWRMGHCSLYDGSSMAVPSTQWTKNDRKKVTDNNANNFGLKRRFNSSMFQRVPVNFLMKERMQAYSRFASVRLDATKPLAWRFCHELHTKNTTTLVVQCNTTLPTINH